MFDISTNKQTNKLKSLLGRFVERSVVGSGVETVCLPWCPSRSQIHVGCRRLVNIPCKMQREAITGRRAPTNFRG